MNLKGNGTGNGGGQLSPYLRIALFAVVIVLVGVLLYRQIDRMAGPKRTVWVPKAELARGAVVGPEDFEARTVRESRVPAGAVTDLRAVVGRQLNRAKEAGAPFVTADFAVAGGNGGSGIAEYVPEGRVMMTLRVGSRSVPYPEMRRGDRLNILSVDRRGGVGGSVASDAYLVGWIEPQAPDDNGDSGKIFGIDLRPPGAPATADSMVSLLLALRPEDVVPLARAQATGARISLVLHGRSEVREGRLLELPSPRRTQVELIAGGKRQNVALQP